MVYCHSTHLCMLFREPGSSCLNSHVAYSHAAHHHMLFREPGAALCTLWESLEQFCASLGLSHGPRHKNPRLSGIDALPPEKRDTSRSLEYHLQRQERGSGGGVGGLQAALNAAAVRCAKQATLLKAHQEGCGEYADGRDCINQADPLACTKHAEHV
eukprot:1140026-Pelagomonas_calceolata.AAC.2